MSPVHAAYTKCVHDGNASGWLALVPVICLQGRGKPCDNLGLFCSDFFPQLRSITEIVAVLVKIFDGRFSSFFFRC